jgi:tocopherol O-methyltransferase
VISPRAPLAVPAVSRHYDDLDRFYREIWGEHVHHGLWERGDEAPAEAAVALARLVASRLEVRPGDRVCDVGCGYGATARLVAREHGCDVTAVTIAPAQHAYAVAVDPMTHNPRYMLRDWLHNGLPDASFEAVFAIESTEHMADKGRCFAEMARVLAPGGRLVVCAWIARSLVSPAEARYMLEPICREGRLPGLGTEEEYRALMERAGITVRAAEDLTARVRRTWPVCVRRLLHGLATRADYRAFLFRSRAADRIFALTMLRIWAAYATGAMRYVMFVGGK